MLGGARRSAALAVTATALAAMPVAPASARTVDVPRRAALTLIGEHRGDLAGASVAPAGDINGDGRADLIVGAPLADPGGIKDAGSAHVVFGGGPRGRLSLGALAGRGFRIDGTVPRPRSFHPGSNPLTSGAGRVVAGAGDVNGDGLDDVLVTGRTPTSPINPTAVFVVFGKRDTAPVSLGTLGAGGFAIHGDGDFVTAVAGRAVGDVNGDGLADVGVAVGVDGDEDAGTVAIVFGKTDAAPVDLAAGRFETPSWGIRLQGGTSSLLLGSADATGAAIAAAGDLNRDGLDDVYLGAAGAAHGATYGTGAVFAVYGSRSPGQVILRPGRPVPGYEIAAPRRGIGYGTAVARLGRGFVAGAPGSPLLRPAGSGALWISPRRFAPQRRLPGPARGGPIGSTVAVPGDVNADGRDELLTVAHGRRDAPVSAYLYASATPQRLATYRGLRNATQTRAAASGAGDVIGNARPDLLFGSPGADRVYVLASWR